MRKYLVLAICCALLLVIAPLSDASVGYQKDGVNSGNASKVDVRGGYSTFDGSTLSVFANGYNDGATLNVSGESNLTSAAVAYGVIQLADTGNLGPMDGPGVGVARYITLADGSPGQMLTILLLADSGGTLFITDDQEAAGTITNTGWDDLGFADALDSVTLLWYNDTLGWIIVGNSGVDVT